MNRARPAFPAAAFLDLSSAMQHAIARLVELLAADAESDRTHARIPHWNERRERFASHGASVANEIRASGCPESEAAAFENAVAVAARGLPAGAAS